MFRGKIVQVGGSASAPAQTDDLELGGECHGSCQIGIVILTSSNSCDIFTTLKPRIRCTESPNRGRSIVIPATRRAAKPRHSRCYLPRRTVPGPGFLRLGEYRSLLISCRNSKNSENAQLLIDFRSGDNAIDYRFPGSRLRIAGAAGRRSSPSIVDSARCREEFSVPIGDCGPIGLRRGGDSDRPSTLSIPQYLTGFFHAL
jgi:hypothetical protein